MTQSPNHKKMNFWDFPGHVRIHLTDQARNQLFTKYPGNITTLASLLHASYPYVCQLRRGLYSMRIDMLLQLIHLCKENPKRIQKHITFLRARSGHKLRIPLPIKSNVNVASLVGHVFGDGYIGKKKAQFEYCNDNQQLIQDVKNKVFQEFSMLPITQRENRIGYSTLIGEVLHYYGAPKSPKIDSAELVPDWITNNEEYETAFIRALFDDDGSVLFCSEHKSQGVNVSIIRRENKSRTAVKLLEKIAEMLKKRNIITGNPRIFNTYNKPDGKRVIALLTITDHLSMKRFNKEIGLTVGSKKEKLLRICSSKRQSYRMKSLQQRNKIVHFLSFVIQMPSKVIATVLNEPSTSIKRILKKLEEGKLIYCLPRTAKNQSQYWRIQEVY